MSYYNDMPECSKCGRKTRQYKLHSEELEARKVRLWRS